MSRQKGFTLLEVLLVLAIISAIIVLGLNYATQKTEQLRRDRTALQMQQILNAAMAYYVNTSSWPMNGVSCGNWTGLQGLINSGYLPATETVNSWGFGYGINCNTTTGTFYVYSQTGTGAVGSANASIIAGQLPMAMATADSTNLNAPTACSDGACYVIGSVNVPGQNLNNARSVNYAGIYSSGACVPAPICPGNMEPEIFVSPAMVNGAITDPTTLGQTPTYYPITGFVAYVQGNTPINEGPSTGPALLNSINDQMVDCGGTNLADCGQGSPSANKYPGYYWRVCLSIQTQGGQVAPTNNAWGVETGAVIAFTRCRPANEPIGTGLQTYTPPPGNF